ncbi:MAG: hypothetical protein FWG07_04460 [Treponema sp.]|nr:hypothetical protein [Treponema sp.]
MDFEYFGLSRDLLYLCSLILGVAIAAFLVTLQKTCTLRRKSVLITVIFCLASCFIASLAVSVILSGGLIFSALLKHPFIILLMVLFFVLGGLALYFPRAGGCSIIFAAGLFLVYMCFSFWIYPGINEPERLVVRASETDLIFRLNAETWDVQSSHNDQRQIYFEAVSITAYPAYPLIGGKRRGVITRVFRNDTELLAFHGAFNRYSKSAGKSWGFLREEFTLALPAGALLPGISLTVLFNGTLLYFDPPIQF